jgi:hypothetical protein
MTIGTFFLVISVIIGLIGWLIPIIVRTPYVDAHKNALTWIEPIKAMFEKRPFLRAYWSIAGLALGLGLATFIFSQPQQPARWDSDARDTKKPTELLWTDVIGVMDAFSEFPKPCFVRLVATKETMNSRNILRRILGNVCEIWEDQADQQIPIPNIDEPAPPAIDGLLLRWDRNVLPGSRVYTIFEGLFGKNVRAGSLPPNQKSGVFRIDVGYGYPWKE